MANPQWHDENGRFKKGNPRGPGGRPDLDLAKIGVKHMRRVLRKEAMDPFTELVRVIPHLKPEKQADILLRITEMVNELEKRPGDPGQPKKAGLRSPMDLNGASVEQLEDIVHGENLPGAATIQGNGNGTVAPSTRSEG